MTAAERIFLQRLKAANIPTPVAEYRFCARRWRFDWAFIEQKVAVEVEGGIWTQGRHNRGAGFLADMDKYNTAATLGWRLLRVTPEQLPMADTITMIAQAVTP